MTHKTPEQTPVADIALRRARADFLEMPGLQLTPAQARRLWMLEADDCEAGTRGAVGDELHPPL